MRFKASIIGDIRKDLQRFDKKLARSSKAAMKEASDGLKGELRAQVVASGLGGRLANTWRSEVYPQGGKVSKDAAASVYSKAPHIVYAYDQGTLIRARNGRYLAVPLPAAQRFIGRNRQRLTPQLFEKVFGIKLAFVPRGGGKNPLLVARGGFTVRKGSGTIRKLSTRKATKRMGERTMLQGLAEVPLFVLIPQAQVRKTLNVERAADKWGGRVPGLIEKRMNSADKG